ncbi:hypothetical protein HMPREF0027_0629 [Actinobacillus ureae ATCC 25976]|uniref:Transferrin-binding protein B C-lobe/N-lobe beta-barrel domain-containing protein n=1 Tax=Actinobacillus ureae ATCC 25976 TaxID=887324 RepID=E8KFL2_9PAST|nr:transferrin-binding protein-like solute binding protein [Actinobacillus ureae]EFX92289.1 hypothetical protein HMPREF0027_0629 [Actinobacillus ureae ATCC 25976]
MPSFGSNVPSNLINPSTPAKAKDTEEKATEKKEPTTPTLKSTNGNVLTPEDTKKILEEAFKDNGVNGNTIKLSGAITTNTDKSFSISNVSDTENQDLNILIMDGQKIELISLDTMKEHRKKSDLIYDDEQLVSNTIFELKNGNTTVGKVGSIPKGGSKYDFEQMRYGYYTDNGKTHLFVQGYMTPDKNDNDLNLASPFSYRDVSAGKLSSPQKLREMPTEKVYEYDGKAFYGNGNDYKELTAKAFADFENHKVKVELLEDKHSKLVFGGNIKGNTFSGNYNGIVSQGAFYGSKANDIGGLFYNTEGTEQGNNGVFGATVKTCGWRGPCTDAKSLEQFNVK